MVLRRTEREKVAREFGIRKAQNSLIVERYDSRHSDLIVYIVDGADWNTGKERMSGGLLSIASLFEETKKLRQLHGAQVMMVTLDSHHLILRHTQFDNDIVVFRLSQVFSYFHNLKHVLIHVPELLVPEFIAQMDRLRRKHLNRIDKLHVNILNQNILLMPPPAYTEDLKRIASHVTMTTAHARYCTEELSNQYKVSVHNISVFGSPEKYNRRYYAQKRNLMIVSPDSHVMKQRILERLQRELPDMEVQVIRNLHYNEYRATIEAAKWAITFGEGLDFYFIESVFSGGISFAVYNDDFFPVEFKTLATVFASYDEMSRRIVSVIRQLDDELLYRECHCAAYALCKKYYQYDSYVNHIKSFYKGDYHINYNVRAFPGADADNSAVSGPK